MKDDLTPHIGAEAGNQLSHDALEALGRPLFRALFWPCCSRWRRLRRLGVRGRFIGPQASYLFQINFKTLTLLFSRSVSPGHRTK